MKNYIKPTIVFIAILLARLLPFRPPNVEPILASAMPLGKKYGILSAVLFSFLSIFIYDIFTAGIGSYTWIAALSYALVACLAGIYMQNKKGSRTNYVMTSVAGIILFDFLTGVVAIPLAGDTTLVLAIMGQIPFTALHLMGGIIFALTISPSLEKWFSTSFAFEKRFGMIFEQEVRKELKS